MTAANTALDQISNSANQDADHAQYLTFIIADEEYGVDVLRVQEIKGWTPVTRIPNTPEFMRGVLNLRGTIVPIIDMRMRFDLGQAEYTKITVIVVLSVHTPSGERVVGIVADAVSDVLDVNPGDIKPTPDFGATINTEFIRGMATKGDAMVMLLDIDKLLSLDELDAVSASESKTEEQDSE